MDGQNRVGEGPLAFVAPVHRGVFRTPERPDDVSVFDLPFSILSDAPETAFARFIGRARDSGGDVVDVLNAAYAEGVAERLTLVHRSIPDDCFRVVSQGDGLRIRNGRAADVGQKVIGGVDPILGKFFEMSYRRITDEGTMAFQFVNLYARDRFSFTGFRNLRYRRFMIPIRENRGTHIVGAVSVSEPVPI
ncbi:MAG: hypothetical protein NXI16_07375 [Alphaproteobacteria bacterium]|nr:hypothetical protein [Alphaproteobacteria bacterium]